VVAANAYLGDVAPFVEPANRLADRGHDVTFLTAPGYHAMLDGERFGLASYGLDFSAAAMHRDHRHERLMRHPFVNQVRLGRYWMRRAWLDDPRGARRSLVDAFAGADVVVSHPTFGSVVVPAAHAAGARVVVGQLFPMMIPTREWLPPVGKRSPSLSAALNGAGWRAFAWGSGAVLYDRAMNEARRSFGLPPVRGVALTGWMSAQRTVILVSRHYYAERAPDWPDVTWGGFSHWPGPALQPPNPALEAYLDSGEAPVLVTLGSSSASGAGSAFAAMASGIDKLGLRSVILVGDERNLAFLPGRDGVFVFAPLARVLPRCRIAVVSGALGTLAAALSAGVPVVVVPQLFDQLWHAGRVEDLGVGIAVLRPDRVADAVARIDGDPRYGERARALAASMTGEDGAGSLVEAAEAVI
jgi:rhamnosyltransferase subunit B